MIYGVYAIKDSKTTFMPPTVDYNDATAIRNFSHACNQSDSLMRSHCQDFTLYRIGSFDDESGALDMSVPPAFLTDGSAVVKE